MISGMIPSFAIFNIPTVGLDMNGGKGCVGRPGFINKMFCSHLVLGLWVCPWTSTSKPFCLAISF